MLDYVYDPGPSFCSGHFFQQQTLKSNSYMFNGWGGAGNKIKPVNPVVGAIWFDAGTGEMQTYDGREWRVVAVPSEPNSATYYIDNYQSPPLLPPPPPEPLRDPPPIGEYGRKMKLD